MDCMVDLNSERCIAANPRAVAWFWRIVLFVAEAAYMLFELLAARTLAPMLGTTLDVWSAVIGCVLLASAVGNWLGGKYCDKPWLPVAALSFASVLCLLVPLLAGYVPLITSSAANVRWLSALLSSLLLFFLPCVGAGALPPFAMARMHEKSDAFGMAAGGVYAAATLGGLAGTFFGGFWLIPLFGTTVLTICVACVYGLLAVACCFATDTVRGRIGRVWHVLSVGSFVASVVVLCICLTTPVSKASASGVVNFSTDTKYGHVSVYDDIRAEGSMRHLDIDGGFESAMWLGDGLESELVFEYGKQLATLTRPYSMSSDNVVGVLGGGAYQIPKYFLDSTHAQVKVCEIDSGVTDIAREWFMLDDVDARNPGRLSIEDEDARVFVESAEPGSFDVLFNDTFAGRVPARVMATREAALAVKKSLRPGGIYVSNVIGDLSQDGFVMHEIATLSDVFGDVALVWASEMGGGKQIGDRGNWLVIAGDDLGTLMDSVSSRVVDIPSLDGVRVLTDDWCPVEAMAAK